MAQQPIGYRVYLHSVFIGIVETNYQWAKKYWASRGKHYWLMPIY